MHEKDLLLHFIQKHHVVVGKTWYEEKKGELVVNTASSETTAYLFELLERHKAPKSQDSDQMDSGDDNLVSKPDSSGRNNLWSALVPGETSRLSLTEQYILK